jgi:hypothetical protein
VIEAVGDCGNTSLPTRKSNVRTKADRIFRTKKLLVYESCANTRIA